MAVRDRNRMRRILVDRQRVPARRSRLHFFAGDAQNRARRGGLAHEAGRASSPARFPYGRQARARGAHLRLRPLARLALEVARPLRRSIAAKLVQVLPGVQPGVVPVVEDELHGVLRLRLDRRDEDVLLAETQYLLPRSVPIYFV